MGTDKSVSVETDLAVRRLIARYSQLADDHDAKAAGDLFTDDGRVTFLGTHYDGRAAIVEWLEGSGDLTSCHAISNVVVSYGSQPGTVHAVSDLLFMRKDGDAWSVALVGRYHDTFSGVGEDLRFSQRIITVRSRS